ALVFNKSTYKLDGLVDYGEEGTTSQEEPADHALVLMFVPLYFDWVQPIASFASKGAAPGHILAKLVLNAIIQLHKHNAFVLAVVSDGAGSNKSMWTKLGISGKFGATCHKLEHPCDPSKTLYFLCDVPHIMKCIRNHLKIHRFGQAGEHLIDYNHYRLLYEVECNEQVRAVPKLSKAHVDPDNLRKMNVRLATQLFSRSTALGIRIYRNERRPDLESSEGTETFTRLLNDLFDALNAKLPLQGIRKTSSGIKIINDFIDLLDLTERNHITNNGIMFASAVTMQSLIVTLLSVRDIIQELLTEGAIYVLTAKLNQDPLERFFGMVRSFGGGEDHPTVITFSYIYRLLSLYTPIKTALRGNIDGEPSTVLATMEEAMRLKKKDKQSSQDRLELLISESFLEL
ncbi:hypothetical protein HPB47_015379, partial [Ixodes persulcatus]